MSKKEETSIAVLDKLKTVEEFQEILDSGAIPPQINTVQKLMTVVQTGKEIGMQPMVAINNIAVIKGKTVISSAMIGALLKGRNIEYEYTKDFEVNLDEEGNTTRIETEITFWFYSKVKGKVDSRKFSVSWAEMERAGYTTKDNWEKYPKNMMRSRCMTYGVRTYFPEIYGGLYTDQEIIDSTTEDGEYVIDYDDNGNPIISSND